MSEMPIIPDEDKPFEDGIELRMVPYDQIVCEDRAREDYGNINELIESFKKDGIIAPIAVKALPDGRYKLLAGGRRFMAASALKANTMPCRIYTKDVSDLDMAKIELAENLYRKDLHFSERVKLDKKIMDLAIKAYGRKESTASDASGVSVRDVAQMAGRSLASFSENINMAGWLEKVPELGKLPTMDDARKLLKEIEKDLTRQEAVRRIQESRATPLDEQLAQLSESFIVGDFFEEIKKIGDQSIKLIEIDPPYAIGLKGVKKQETPAFDLDRYNEIDQEAYPGFMNRVLSQSWRVLQDGGWLILWFGPDPWFEPVYQMLKGAFQTFRLPGIWVKTNSTGQTHNPAIRLGQAYEMFFYARKGDATLQKQGRPNTFLYDVVANQRKIHPTERPVELIQDILETFARPGDKVLVPFLGSGNTLLAASNLGMPAVGFELGKELKEGFVIRVYESKPGLYKSYKAGKESNE